MRQAQSNGRLLVTLALTILSGWVVVSAVRWPFKAALFPVSIGALVFLLSLTALILILTGKDGSPEDQGGVDTELSDEIIDRRRETAKTWQAFGWVVGFCLAILFFGFYVAVPLFVFLYTKVQGKETWRISVVMTLLSGFFFWAIFVWLLDLPLRQGLVQQWLRLPV